MLLLFHKVLFMICIRYRYGICNFIPIQDEASWLQVALCRQITDNAVGLLGI